MTDDLIALALELAERDDGPPREVSIRKAISTAYYALFHALLETFADQVAGREARQEEAYASIYRFPEHGALLKRLFDVDDHEVRTIGATLKTLQELRMKADYDPAPFGMGKSEAKERVQHAETAALAVRALGPKQRLAVTVAVLSSKRR